MDNRYAFSLRLRRATWMTVFIFVFSLALPSIQCWAFESDFYDGPGGYLSQGSRQTTMNRTIDRQVSMHQSATDRQNKLMGMVLGGAAGGGLALALGIAASPVFAAVAVIGGILAGGFIADQFGTPARRGLDRATDNSNFMSWAGGLAGGALGFLIPGGSIIGAALGAGIGGMAGNALSDNKHQLMDFPNRMMQDGMGRLGGGFMGPAGTLAEGPMFNGRMMGMNGQVYPGGWYGDNGMFRPGVDPAMSLYGDPTMMGTPNYVWHDNNGELAYPGWESDLYRLDGSHRVTNNTGGWTLGTETVSGGSRGYEGGSSIENPDWGTSGSTSGNVRPGRMNYEDGDVWSTYVTTDGETFNPGYELGSDESLVNLTTRYQDAVEELRMLTSQGAPANQRQRAHQEVQRLERLLQGALR